MRKWQQSQRLYTTLLHIVAGTPAPKWLVERREVHQKLKQKDAMLALLYLEGDSLNQVF